MHFMLVLSVQAAQIMEHLASVLSTIPTIMRPLPKILRETISKSYRMLLNYNSEYTSKFLPCNTENYEIELYENAMLCDWTERMDRVDYEVSFTK